MLDENLNPANKNNKKIKFSNKILIFAPEYFPKSSSTAIHIKGITDNIDIVKFDMITTRMNRNLSRFDRIGKINVYRYGIGIPIIDKYLLAFFGHLFAEKLYKIKKYKAIWGIGSDYGSFAAMFFKQKHPKMPFLLTLRNEDDPKHFRKKIGFLDPFFKKIFNLADYIQCINERLLKWGRRMGCLNPISIVPHGISYETFRKGPLREFHIDSLKYELSIKKNEKVIIAGPCMDKKMTKTLIKSISLLSNLNKIQIKLLLFESKKYKKYFQKIANKFQIKNKLIFVDKINYENMPNYLWISDIFIHMSKEAFPSSITFLAAMAAQVPIISAKKSKVPDFFIKNKTGLICDYKDPVNIADRIETLLDKDSQLRKKIIKNGEYIASNQYNYEKIKIVFEKIYDKLFEMNKKTNSKN